MEDFAKTFDNLNINSNFDDPGMNPESVIELINKIRESLLENETCPAWIKNVSKTNLDIAMRKCSDHFEELARNVGDESASNLRYSAIEMIAKRCIQIQVHITKKNFSEATDIVAEANRLIDECLGKNYVPTDYSRGFRYVIECLEISIKLENESSNFSSLDELKLLLSQIQQFEKLTAIERCGILGIKQYFIGNLTLSDHQKQMEVIKKLIEMDPHFLEWRYCLYSVSSFERRARGVYIPSEEEKSVILDAINRPNAHFDPRIRLSYAYCLAEMMPSFQHSLQFGRKYFSNITEAIDLIRDEIEEVLSIDPASVRTNITIAKIYSSILPQQFRDKDFAKLCIERALLFHPNSSKANHRMGIFQLKNGNVIDSITYFRKAVDTDERNMYALTDLLDIYLALFYTYRNETQSLMERILKSNYYITDSKKYAHILFMQAMYKYVEEKPDESIEIFIKAYSTDPEVGELFKKTIKNIEKFDKKQQFINTELLRFFKKKYDQATDAATKQKINRLLIALTSALENTSYENRYGRYSKQSFRGNRGNYSRKSYGSNDGSYSKHSYSSYGNQYGSDWRKHKSDDSKNESKSDNNFTNKTQDSYAILGVLRSATKSEIKKAYHTLALQNHPDKHMKASDKERLQYQEKMKIINKAYHELINITG